MSLPLIHQAARRRELMALALLVFGAACTSPSDQPSDSGELEVPDASVVDALDAAVTDMPDANGPISDAASAPVDAGGDGADGGPLMPDGG